MLETVYQFGDPAVYRHNAVRAGTSRLIRIARDAVGCVEQARATVRPRSQERLLMVCRVSSAPQAAYADAPWTCASLTHPTRIMRA